MLQDLNEHIFNNQYTPRKATDDDYLIISNKDTICFQYEDTIVFPKVSEFNIDRNQLIYLFELDHVAYFTYLYDSPTIEGYHYYSIKDFRLLQPQHLAFILVTAYQIICFYKEHQYCPQCGQKMSIDLKERMMKCDVCHHTIYPQICPAVIVGVIHNDEILLTQYIQGKNYALVAGYNEVGETIEETVIREVKEETGLDVEHLHYYKSQPWAISKSLLFGFYCEVKGDTTIVVDHSELSVALWVSRVDIPVGYSTSLTAEMMLNFKEKGRDVFK